MNWCLQTNLLGTVLLVAAMGAVGCSNGPGEVPKDSGDPPDEPNCATPDAECDEDEQEVLGGTGFQTSEASTIEFTAAGGSEFCVDPDGITRVEVDVATGMSSATILMPGPAASDRCVATENEPCMVPHEVQFEITEQQLTEVIELMAAVPAPSCEVDAARTCDPCAVHTLRVDDVSYSDNCCGQQSVSGFARAFDRASEYLRSLVPQFQPAFSNPTSFTTLSYGTTEWFGSCYGAGDLLSATITRDSGRLFFEARLAELGDPDTDDCMERPDSDECLVSVASESQLLTPETQTELERLLAEIPAPMCVEDPQEACDPCLIESITVDRASVDDFCCGTTSPGFSTKLRQVTSFLKSL